MLAEKLRAATASVSYNPAAWNLADATWQGSPINYYGSSPAYSTFFRDDGLKFYNANTNNDSVQEYSLSTAWDISTASYVQGFSVGAQGGSPGNVVFKPDGTKMYVSNRNASNQRVIDEYNLSTAWDVSTASYVQRYILSGLIDGVRFKPDGFKMYVADSNSDRIDEYNLSTAWDISTLSFLQSFSVAAQTTFPNGLFLKSDGLKFYVPGPGNLIYEYNLAVAWDISTASYLQSYTPSLPGVTGLSSPFFKPDGFIMYCYASGVSQYYQFQLTTAWDVSTASFTYPSNYFSVANQETNPRAIFFKPDGFNMYVIGSSGDDVNQYSLSAAWDITTASYVQNFSVAAQDTEPRGLSFKPDGTKMYFAGQAGDDVNEYTLSTAWDISTSSYVQSFSFAAQQTSPTSFFFKPDGLKMYVLGVTGVGVYEYNLSTAWDISTASYVQSFISSSQDSTPTGLFFKPDGLKMYITGQQGDNIYEYNLLTAWDVSTASYFQSFNVAQQSGTPYGLFFKPNGLVMYILDLGADVVYSYNFV